MFCHKCGNELCENAAYCPSCGTPLQKKEKSINYLLHKKTIWSFVIVIVVAITVTIWVICVPSYIAINKSPASVAEAFVDGCMNHDAEKIIQCLPDCMIPEVAYDLYLEYDTTREELIDHLEKYLTFECEPIEEKAIIHSNQTRGYGKVDDNILEEYIDWGYLPSLRNIEETETVVLMVSIGEHNPAQVYLWCIKMDGLWYCIGPEISR